MIALSDFTVSDRATYLKLEATVGQWGSKLRLSSITAAASVIGLSGSLEVGEKKAIFPEDHFGDRFTDFYLSRWM